MHNFNQVKRPYYEAAMSSPNNALMKYIMAVVSQDILHFHLADVSQVEISLFVIYIIVIPFLVTVTKIKQESTNQDKAKIGPSSISPTFFNILT